MHKIASNSIDVRIYNRILIRNIIRKMGPIARYELAKETGLTPPTITAIVNELMEDGIVMEVGYGESKGGRRPVMLELNSKAAYIFAVRIQRDEVVTALFDIGGNILEHHRQILDTSLVDDVVEAVGNSFDWLIENTGIKKDKVLCCGVASPGLINIHRGLIVHSSNLKWDQVPIGALLSKRLYGIPIYIENISNAAALAEKEYGCGRGYHDLVYLNLSVGIGAGIIIDDKLYGGSRGYAGEIGHMLLYEPQFSKGQISYFESIFGFGAIIERIKEKLPAEVFSEYGLNKSRLKAGDFLSSPIMERKEVQEILEESARGIGITVANLVSIFNPELIILGGELPKVSEKFVDIVIQEMNKHVLEEFVSTVKVVNSTMKDDPPLIGAYALALDMLFSIEKWDL